MGIRNPAADPFTPGSGHPPPYLAGRSAEVALLQDRFLESLRVARAARPVLFTGIRGVGKTALLIVARRGATELSLPVVRLEASRQSVMLDTLVFQLEEAITRLSSRLEATRRALSALEEFKLAVHVAGSGIEVGATTRRAGPSSDHLFRTLMVAAAKAAAEDGHPLVVTVDEIHLGPPELLAPLLATIHEINQDDIPLGVVAAGLPHTDDWIGKHVAYGGRMFDQRPVGLLDAEASKTAYIETLSTVPGEAFTEEAVTELVTLGQGLPYFIQEYGSATWETADNDPISLSDVQAAVPHAERAVARFYEERWAEAAPREQEYLAALAQLADQPQPSGAIADELGTTMAAVAYARRRLIQKKGLLYEPERGHVEWSLPGMREWVRSTVPDSGKRSPEDS